MRKRRTFTRRGVVVTDLGCVETHNGIAWAAEVEVGGRLFHVSNDGNGGSDMWRRARTDGHVFEGVDEATAALAALARTEPSLSKYADIMRNDHEAAGLFIGAVLDAAAAAR